MSKVPRILVLSAADEPVKMNRTDTFVTALNDRLDKVAQVEWHNYQDIRLILNTNHIEAFVQSSGESLSGFRFVYFKSFFRKRDQAGAIAAYLDSTDVPYVCSELRYSVPLSKLMQYVRLAQNGLPIPKSVFMDRAQFSSHFEYLKDTLGAPFIFKATEGSCGSSNYLIYTERALQKAIQENPDINFIAQRFIENDSDLRLLIVGKELRLVIQRTRNGDSHLNNTTQGSSARLVPLKEIAAEHKALALHAAEVMNREIAGVDLMFEKGTGNPYFLEVNASPQIGSGAYTEEKLTIYSNYFKNMLK